MKSIFSDPFLSESDRAKLDRLSEPSSTGPMFASMPPPLKPEVQGHESAPLSAPQTAPQTTPFTAPVAYPAPSASSPLAAVISKPAPQPQSDEDPITLMRKIVMGGQVDDLKERLHAMEQQLHHLRAEMDQKVKAMETALRAEFTEKLEKSGSDLSATMDERFRKVSAASVPRTHLAEILRDLSSRLHPSGV